MLSHPHTQSHGASMHESDLTDGDSDSSSLDHSVRDDVAADTETIDKELEWATRQPCDNVTFSKISKPIVIPQTTPALASLFRRAWAPELADHDIKVEEWLQFLDHLNVCKTASPPLQVLDLAGSAAGFVPNHWAQIASFATSVIANGGMFAVSKVRVGQYLKRANEVYFLRRGLMVQIAKQSNIHEITGQQPSALMLDDFGTQQSDSVENLDLVDLRMQMFQDRVATLQYDELPALTVEQSRLDRMTAKMNAMKAARSAKKSVSSDDRSDAPTNAHVCEDKKVEKERRIRERAEKEMARKPRKGERVQRKMERDLAKIGGSNGSKEREHRSNDRSHNDKREKKLGRLMFLVVQNVREPQGPEQSIQRETIHI